MKRRVLSSAFISSCVLISGAVSAGACGAGSTSITNLFSANNDSFQVLGLNGPGQLTGYTYGGPDVHAFLYQNGTNLDLGTLGGSLSEGFAVSSSGQVVGTSLIAGDAQFSAFVYSAGALQNLDTLSASYSSASLINDAGQIAGNAILPNASDTTAFLFSNTNMVGLGTLGGAYSSAFSLNNAGQVVGESSVANDDLHAFLFSGSAMSDLGTLGGTYSSAFSINDAGTVVGESALANADIHGFVFSGSAMTDLGTLGGTYSSAFKVNTNGVVIGIATTAGDAETHAFVYKGSGLVDLGTLGRVSIMPSAINNREQVVGTASAADGSSVAFLWQTNQIVDLNTLLPANSGWQLTSAQFINDSGRVVGVGLYNGTYQPYILDLPTGNNPPVAVAGADQTIDCQAQATLDGSASSDPDNDPLTFEWSLGSSVLGTGSVLSISLPLGTNIVTLKVSDPCGASSETSARVIVADSSAPSILSGPGTIKLSADSNCQATIPSVLGSVLVADNCTPANQVVLTQTPAAGTVLSHGSYTIVVTATDASGNQSAFNVPVEINDTTAPLVLSTPAPVTISSDAHCHGTVPNVLPGVVATDNCTPANHLVLIQSPAAGTSLPDGQYTIKVSVSDAAGNTTSFGVPLSIVDTTAPVIQSLVASPDVLSPPNHQLVSVTISAIVCDNCDASPATKITSITCNEVTAPGDIQITGDLCATLAASKSSSGTARIYTITVQSKDSAGNTSSGVVTVSVPKSNGNSGSTSNGVKR
jgi:probable HAF family extracellular repeat protein